jgi:hypothetical protein
MIHQIHQKPPKPGWIGHSPWPWNGLSFIGLIHMDLMVLMDLVD